MRPQSFVTFPSRFNDGKPGTTVDLSWEELKAFFQTPTLCAYKQQSAAIFGKTKGNLRGDANVESRGYAVLDLENPLKPDGKKQGLSAETIAAELEKLDAIGCSYLVHSTYSSTHYLDGLFRVRVIIPLAFSVPASEWRDFADDILAVFPSQDPKVKNEERLFFLPSVPNQEAFDNYFFVAEDGKFFASPENFKKASVTKIPPLTTFITETQKTAAVVITSDNLKTLANKLSRKTDEKDKANARTLRKLIKGESIADQGSRHNTAIAAIGLIASHFPGGSADSVASLFSPVLSVWAKDGEVKMTEEYIAAEFAKFVALDAKEKAEREAKKAADEQLRLALFAAADRKKALSSGDANNVKVAEASTGFYSVEELELCKRVSGAKTDDELKRRWIVYFSGGSCAFLGPYGYSKTYGARVASAGFRNELARADLDMQTDEAKPITITTAMERFGFLANEMVYSLSAQFSYYDDRKEVFVKSICPLATDLDVRYKPEWDKLIELMAGKKADRLRDWLACVTKVDRPVAAMYLDATQGAGKGLLINALCALWKNGRAMDFTELSKQFQYFNSPLVTINEGLNAKASSEVLRRIIGDTGMRVSQKFESDGFMTGCVRVIVTANNADVLSFGRETLGLSDQVATAKRIISIEGERIPAKDGEPETSEASLYLAQMAATDGLTLEERAESLAGHILWLNQNRKVEAGRRFLVEGDDQAVVNNIVTGTRHGDQMCQVMIGFVADIPMEAEARPLARIVDGELQVTARFVSAAWKTFHDDGKGPPSPISIGKTLKSLCVGKLAQERVTLGKHSEIVNFWRVDTAKLEHWCQRSDYMTVEALREALGKDKNNGVRKPPLGKIQGGNKGEANGNG